MISEVLKEIASELDQHIDNGRPYDLTFYSSSQIVSPSIYKDTPYVSISDEQEKSLQAYLKYNFHEIWGKTWIKGEAERLRLIAKAIREVHRTLTVIDPEVLDESKISLEHLVEEVKQRLRG